jgi:hypothetical protein
MYLKKRYLIHWMLIAMLAILPYRSVMAMESGCNMNDTATHDMVDHSMHMAMDMQMEHSIDSAKQDCCCCDTAMVCSSDCSSGIHFSFIIQQPVPVAANYLSSLIALADNEVLLRAPSPPIRPPANLPA